MGDADGRRALGAEHLAPACTTHFSVVDKDGNMAAVTQTLLSTFGSKFVTPKTGITMNNGIMWFDPTQGVPNSLAPGKRCLTNYTPVVAQAADGRRLAVGASGGRRILPAVTQLLSFVMDFGMDLDTAIHQPRIDASEGAIVIGDVRLPAPVREALRKQFDYEEARIQTFPMKFACPSVTLRDGTTNFGATESCAALGRCGGGRLRTQLVLRCVTVHLNCGTAGTVMFGCGSGGILEAFPIPLGSVTLPCAAPIKAAFGRTPPAPTAAEPICLAATEPPPPRANEAAGAAKIRIDAIASFIVVFDIGSSVRRIAPQCEANASSMNWRGY